ncbi:hypothetical protein B5S30_g1726 [[Candida] boidinii]|nr:hypothetical protein B5S30_g1726 [[Candida] boidinii]
MYLRQLINSRKLILSSNSVYNSSISRLTIKSSRITSTNTYNFYNFKRTMSSGNNNNKNFKVQKTDEEWRAILSPEQFAILRKKSTERPNTGEYNKFNKEGIYNCAGCNQPIYKSSTKFDAHCGWPAFYEAIEGSIVTVTDTSMGMTRTEMMCSNCGGHLGHIFTGEGFNTPTDARHCVNSISLKFKPKENL